MYLLKELPQTALVINDYKLILYYIEEKQKIIRSFGDPGWLMRQQQSRRTREPQTIHSEKESMQRQEHKKSTATNIVKSSS